MTWEELQKEIQIRNLATMEVEERIDILESMVKTDITRTCYQNMYEQIAGFMLDIKSLQSEFRKKAFEAGLMKNEHFLTDCKAIVQWQVTSWNRLDKLRPRAMPIPNPGVEAAVDVADQSSMHDALYTLNATLQQSNENRDLSVNISKPSFKGGEKSFSQFEAFSKKFKTYTRKIKDKVHLLQLLRDTLGGDAYKLVAEFDVIADNYDLAWKRLNEVYKKPEECLAQLVDKIFGFQFNINIEKFDETFNNYSLLIDKLKTSHNIDLLDNDSGVHKIIAHLTFKKFPQQVKNVLLQLCSTHYPTFNELKLHIPTAVDRIKKQRMTIYQIVA